MCREGTYPGGVPYYIPREAYIPGYIPGIPTQGGLRTRLYTLCTPGYTPLLAPPYVHPGIHPCWYTTLCTPGYTPPGYMRDNEAHRALLSSCFVWKTRRIELSFLPVSVKDEAHRALHSPKESGKERHNEAKSAPPSSATLIMKRRVLPSVPAA